MLNDHTPTSSELQLKASISGQGVKDIVAEIENLNSESKRLLSPQLKARSLNSGSRHNRSNTSNRQLLATRRVRESDKRTGSSLASVKVKKPSISTMLSVSNNRHENNILPKARKSNGEMSLTNSYKALNT